MVEGSTNFNGAKVVELPVSGIVPPAVIAKATPSESRYDDSAEPAISWSSALKTASAVKSTKSTVTVEPGFDVVDLGVAPAF
jgi:hypothetical protein